jgi:phosphatidylglycerol:prolipoprotein diacylglycerol transferase
MIPLQDRIGPFFIYSYTVVLSFGMLAAIGLTAWLAKKEQVKNWFDAVLVCLIFGVIGGRFGFVWANWDYFQDHTASIHKVWLGGYSFIGALFAGILGLWLWCLWMKRRLQQAQQTSFSSYTDLLAPGFALLCAFGWLACWFEGCAYGLETIIGPFAADLPDEFGIFAVRYQTQMMGMIGSLIIFAFVMLTRTRWHTGQLFWLTLGLLSLLNMGISLLRGDPTPMIEPYRLNSVIYGTIVLISAVFMLYYQKGISKS